MKARRIRSGSRKPVVPATRSIASLDDGTRSRPRCSIKILAWRQKKSHLCSLSATVIVTDGPEFSAGPNN
jgi:hypothetical protein